MSALPEDTRHPFLSTLGDRVRDLRARKGMTRRAVALAAGVSERHLANLESGTGNASILILLQVAQAIVSLSDIGEILGTIIRIMPILVGVQRAALFEWEEWALLLEV